MARRGWSNSNYLQCTSTTPVTAMPFTLAVWGRTSITATIQNMVVNNSSGDPSLFSLRIGTNDRIQASSSDAASTTASGTGPVTTITANTWFHAAAVFTSTTSRTAYFNGVAGTTSTTANTPSAPDRLTIGVRNNSVGVGVAFAPAGTGDLAHAAVWNISLAAIDVAALATGVSPLLIRPEALVAYWPLVGVNSPENNLLSNAQSLTMTGTLTQSDQPIQFGAG